MLNGVAAAIEHAQCLSTLSPELVVDIGANCGQFALVAREHFPKARIISFEPLRRPGDKFAAVFKRDRMAELHRVAIGPAPGTAVMHVSAQLDSSSLLPITPDQSRIFEGTHSVGREQVRVDRLSSFLKAEEIQGRRALLKVDVQGYELEALDGCEPLLGRFDHILVECSFIELYASQALADEVVAFLRTRSFALAGVFNVVHHDRRPVQADFLFEHRAQPE